MPDEFRGRDSSSGVEFAADSEAGHDDGEVSFDGVSGVVEHGLGCEVVFGDTEGLLYVPQVVVVIDYLGRGHDRFGNVCDVSV